MDNSVDFTGLVGIDLGTTYSCVARLTREGNPQTVPNREGELTTPSVLMIEEGLVVVGAEAKRSECVYPDRTAVCVKRDMGRSHYSRSIDGHEYRPEMLSAMILRRIKADVERRFGPIHNAVITVPAYFDDTRRKATQDAGRIAGLNVLDIINEPTAAALAYAFEDRRKELPSSLSNGVALPSSTTSLVYDLGGGTFDVSLVRCSHERFETLATDGDVRLGGRDWDERLVEFLAGEFRRKFGSDPHDDPQSISFLYQEVERAKLALSVRLTTKALVTHNNQRLSIELSRRQFDDLTADLVARTAATTEQVIDSAGLDWSKIDRVLLVGGMTRVPHIRDMIEKLSGKVPVSSLPADEVVAHGAALHGGMLLSRLASRNQSPSESTMKLWAGFETIDVNSHSLGIAVRTPTGYANSILIPKNTPLPAERSRIYHTSAPNQRQVRVRILEGESRDAESCVQIGEFVITGLPPHLPERSPVEVVCRYGSDGRITVQGRDPASGTVAESSLVPQGRLGDDEISDAARTVGALEIV